MDSMAQMACIMKVHLKCDGCKKKVMEICQNLRGVYSLDIDADGTIKINGQVYLATILRVFDKYGNHGELSSLKFDGEVKELKACYYSENGYVDNGSLHLPPYGPYPQFSPQEHQWYGTYPYPILPPSQPPIPPPSPTPPYAPTAPPMEESFDSSTDNTCCTIM